MLVSSAKSGLGAKSHFSNMVGSNARRVVVTGLGLITPVGCNLRSSWYALCGSKSANLQASVYELRHGNEQLNRAVVMRVHRDELQDSLPRLLGRDVPLQIRFGLASAAAAISDANLPSRFNDHDAPNVGTSIGVGMAHVPDLVDAAQQLAVSKPRRISPFLVPRVLVNTCAGLVAQVHNLQGPNTAPSTACAAGAHAVIEGFHSIMRGESQVMIVGGSEAAIEDVGIAGFLRANALSRRFVDSPDIASRPFDSQRDGFVMGEGAGMLVLENAEHALQRGVDSAYAEIRGAGMSGDAYHITSPPPCGRGAMQAMSAALRSAHMHCSDVDYINAHATGTPVGDAVERRAIAKLFSNGSRRSNKTLVSSIKGCTGHLLGASGAVETAVTALAISCGEIPGTRNLDTLDQDGECSELGWADIERYVPRVSRKVDVDVAMSNSFGFGGTNASILLTSPPQQFRRRSLISL